MENSPTADFSEPNTDGPITEATVHRLIDESAANRVAVDQLRHSIDRAARGNRWTRIIGAGLILVLAFLWLDNRAQLASLRRQFCPVVETFIPRPGDPLPAPGPGGDRGRLVIREMRSLADQFGCDAG